MCKPGCSCKKASILRVNQNAGEWRVETFEGRDHAVFPVVMAKGDVVMNGRLFPVEEYFPTAWNGVLVTVDHPYVGEEDRSASDPKIIEEFGVGRVFNTEVKDGALVGEVWVDLEKLQRVSPECFHALEEGLPLDVSTGLFSSVVEKKGSSNGREYTEVIVGVIPNHLALLPNDTGACGWSDGCGIRTHKEKTVTFKEIVARLNAAKKKTVKNEDEASKADVIAALLAAEGSPFTEADRPALEAMSDSALMKCAEMCAPKPAANTEEEEEVPVANSLSADDKAALVHARKAYEEHKSGLIKKIVAHSDMKEPALKAMDVVTLEVIANGLKAPAATDGGVVTVVNVGEDDKKVIAQITSGGVMSRFKKKEA